MDDPWSVALATGDWEEPAVQPGPPRSQDRSSAYLSVHSGEAFQEVRRRYRRFVLPASAAFLAWYLLYVVAAITAPGLMGRPVAGAVNVAMIAAFAQFATTFLMTWAYVRHARRRRDRAAQELRWTLATRNPRGGQEHTR